jgi:hypothetical protein
MTSLDLLRYAEDKACATPEGLKAKLLADLLPAIEGIDIQNNRVLVAQYITANVTPGGIIRPFTNQDEDRWQGKIGLVLKVGPLAFQYDEVMAFINDEEMTWDEAVQHFGLPEVGDWVQFRNSETHEVGIVVAPGVAAPCRYINDNSIISKVADPTVIY